MISKINTLSPSDPSLRQLHKKWDTPDFHRGLSCALLQLRLILSCGWPDFRGLNTSCDWLFLRATRVSAAAYDLRLSGVPTVGFKLRMSQVPATGYKLRLTPSYGWLKFGQLETSCGRWMQVVADIILWLALVPAAEYELRLILSCGWLEFRRLDKGCSWPCPTSDLSYGGWIRVTADSILRLTRVLEARYDVQLIHPAADYKLWLILSCSWLEFRRLDSKRGWLIL